MARTKRASQKTDFIATITDTIANHPRLSAAVAFQMGILLGQVMQNRGDALGALKRGVGAAPMALASALPNFRLFADEAAPAPRRKSRRPARRKARKA